MIKNLKILLSICLLLFSVFLNKPVNAQTAKRLDITQQSKDGRGVYLPLSENAGVSVGDIMFSQIFIHDKFNIQVFFVDLKKYPKIKNHLITYGEKLALTLSDSSFDEKKFLDIYVFSTPKDLYYLRNVNQSPKELELALMKISPLIHVKYNPKVSLSVCRRTTDGYREVGRTSFNSWKLEGGLPCGYSDLIKMYNYWDKK